jgi:DNA repair protein RadC
MIVEDKYHHEFDSSNIQMDKDDTMPREKMIAKGKESLTNIELLAILINIGTKNKPVKVLAEEILNLVENNITELGKKDISFFKKIKGIGEAKAITIAAALELGFRREKELIQNIVQITSSKDAYNYLKHEFKYKSVEEFWILHLNHANRIIGKERISVGGMTSTTADPKVIFSSALLAKATSVILFHNHPSGNLKPSQSDLELTRKLYAAGKFLDIKILDHIIVTDDGFYSFSEEGILGE